MTEETTKNFYGDTITLQEPLEDGHIRILVLVNGAEVEYHVTQEELDNAHREPVVE